MSRRIGFFEDFKGSDTVLLSITAPQASILARELETFAASGSRSLTIESDEIPGHRTTLVAVRECGSGEGNGFRWLCGPAQVVEVAAKLRALGNARKGHHYFELCHSSAQLMVSVGEYAY